jgi:inner membrane protein
MDLVTHFALGAGIGAAVLGRRVGLRKAALTGGLIASLPDLDVFWPYDDPLDFLVNHRGATHSLLMQTLAAPLLGEGLRRLLGALKDRRLQAYLAVYLCLTSHALADYFTVYRTQLFWPVWPEPLGLGSIFIIDPLFTLPLLVVMVWALFRTRWTPRYGGALALAFTLSGAYLGWSVLGQNIAEGRSARALADAGLRYDKLMATPTPFNTLFWRAIALDGSKYYNVYVPLLGGDDAVTVYAHERWPEDLACWLDAARRDEGATKTRADFSDDYFLAAREQGKLHLADLRMGLSHAFVFRFAVADVSQGLIKAVTPYRVGGMRPAPGDFDWLWTGVTGRKSIRPAERAEFAPNRRDHSIAATPMPAKKC